MEFVWDQAKNKLNKSKHGISFEVAIGIFSDPGLIERYDARHSGREDRWIGIGIANTHLLFVVYAIKERDTYRIISARKANEQERREYCGL